MAFALCDFSDLLFNMDNKLTACLNRGPNYFRFVSISIFLLKYNRCIISTLRGYLKSSVLSSDKAVCIPKSFAMKLV